MVHVAGMPLEDLATRLSESTITSPFYNAAVSAHSIALEIAASIRQGWSNDTLEAEEGEVVGFGDHAHGPDNNYPLPSPSSATNCSMPGPCLSQPMDATHAGGSSPLKRTCSESVSSKEDLSISLGTKPIKRQRDQQEASSKRPETAERIASKKNAKNARRARGRERKCEARCPSSYTIPQCAMKERDDNLAPIESVFDAENGLAAASTAWIGLRLNKRKAPDAADLSLKKLVEEEGMQLINWDGQ
jgi:hypothetical protein